ncbi:MAG: Quinolinate synthase A [Candidatus Methanogasteraceae archaeon]|nr:MAG: Quinolinate synthase A [ANME-2 cluster archaeon]
MSNRYESGSPVTCSGEEVTKMYAKNSGMIEKILKLKQERNAVILAHNYERPEIQDIADFVGDSLALSIEASLTNADVILFCGVDFMAESAAILSPDKTVLIPDTDARCPMAAMITEQELIEMKQRHPDARVVCYVNTSAAVKAESDICCTSANAVEVVESLDCNEIIFVPDKNLARYAARFTEKKIIPWDGYCHTHHQILPYDITDAKQKHPDAEVLVHPECRPEVIDLADGAYGTEGMVKYAGYSHSDEFIIGTESGMLHRLEKEFPEKRFYAVSDYAICPAMKMVTLSEVARSLENLEYVVAIPGDVQKKAKDALDRMIKVKRRR